MTLGTFKIELCDDEIRPTFATMMLSPGFLDFENKAIEITAGHQGFKTESQGIRINRRQFPKAHAYLDRPGPGVAGGFGPHRFKNRIGDSHFVHRTSMQPDAAC